VANALVDRFDLVIASQDWHPADHRSFAANHEGREPGEVIHLNGLEQIVWPVHCVQDTAGAAFAAELNRGPVEYVVRKGTDAEIDSYSAFFDNGRRRATDLEGILRSHGIEHVHILGLATDYCVEFSALDARELGFRTTLVEDGCRAVDLRPTDGEDAFDAMRSAGIELCSSDDL
jgi:nicotinamidase/pyrazinamidase